MNKQTGLELLSEMAKKTPHYENSKLLDYRDESLTTQDFLHEQLGDLGIVGNVISTYRDDAGKLHYIVDTLTNCIIMGATGSGKSTGPFSAQCQSIAESGVASAIIIDSKGAMYSQYASAFRSCGYQTLVVNLRDPEHSEGWNIFAGAAEEYAYKMNGIGGDAHIFVSPKGKTSYHYKGKVFADKKSLQNEYEREEKQYEHELYTAMYEICVRMWPIESTKDPYWEKSSRVIHISTATRLTINLFAIDKKSRTTIDQINFASIKAIFETFEVRNGRLDDKGFLSDRGEDSIAFAKVKKNIYANATTTLSNILGFGEQQIHKYDYTSFLTLSMATTFNVRDLVSKKTVLFITYDEMDPLNRNFISLFISWLIQELKKIADNSERLTLERPVLFMIDEFASLARNQDIVNAIAYARSRNIVMHLVIQSDSQVFSIYGEADGRTLFENCNTTIYLGSNNWKTLQDFSASLGRCTMISPTSVLSGGNVVLEERPLVPCSALAIFSQGEGYVRRLGKHALKAHFEKSYECPEYTCEPSKLSGYKSNLIEMYPQCQYDVSVLTQTVAEDDDNDDDDDLF